MRLSSRSISLWSSQTIAIYRLPPVKPSPLVPQKWMSWRTKWKIVHVLHRHRVYPAVQWSQPYSWAVCTRTPSRIAPPPCGVAPRNVTICVNILRSASRHIVEEARRSERGMRVVIKGTYLYDILTSEHFWFFSILFFWSYKIWIFKLNVIINTIKIYLDLFKLEKYQNIFQVY